MPDRVEGHPVTTGPRRRKGVVQASSLYPDKSRFSYGPPFDVWQLGVPHGALLYGPPGSGKSTLATRMAVGAARRTDVLYLAVEEGHSATLVDRLHRAGLDDLSGRRLRVSDARTHHEVSKDLEGDSAKLVVVDSITDLAMPPDTLVSMLDGKSYLCVSHVNSRNAASGGPGWSHAVDLTVWCESGKAEPEKNRWGPMDSIQIW